ncbi:hypothetical protein LTR10_018705 [Elasticomyces elasticus]|uniref:Major facilitator superfamily (MFS) profile domain-containing protein n=1 Tax=Exophiala sideris TaxID=1016849 RepID=A0ABR0JC18_9EURO|nr:hypothetical protein LTR10_018705 [Elasticomyces elasticus]KAK5026260.1 hypothetical protein LTS07_007785 [Exophiala sideris]KAK5032513.1 hypothetical protein LTR13_007336 [Exophiala sideris]KAK5059672.1 hypothetical protein LTR69_006261 [Exophiala sideris]KAK5178045.1 hypothetical protein LTR44_009351 [Eurotiomycetes sp. CCFEE 6388]
MSAAKTLKRFTFTSNAAPPAMPMASTAERHDLRVAVVDGLAKHPPQENHVETKGTYDADDIHQAALADNPERAEKPNLSTILSIVFVGASIVAPIACGFIVATSILYQIGTALGDTTNLGWVVSGWSIASSVSFSLAGSLSDIFGRRCVILSGEVISLIGSVIASTSTDLSTLIVGSTLLGFSCGFVLVSYAAIPELLPNKYRGLGIACIEGFLTIPWVALAFLLGNLFVIHATWRWVYYICIIYSAFSLTGTAVFYFPASCPRPENNGKTKWREFLELDFVGILLYTTGLTSILLGLSWGGTVGHAWGSASVIAPIVLGGVAFISAFVYDFVVVEKTGRHTLFPRHLLSRLQEFTVSLVVIFIAGMVYYTMSALLPEATELVYGSTPLQVGVLLLPNGLGQFVGTCIFPLFLHKTGQPARYVLVGVLLQTLFTALYAYGISGHKAAWSAFQFFGAGPFGLITVTTVFNAGLHVRPSELGIAVGLLGTFRSMGGSVGNAVFGTILRSVADIELPRQITAAALSQGFTGNLSTLVPAVIETGNGVPNALASVGSVTPAIEKATLQAFSQAYAQAYRMVFYSTIPFGVIAVLAAFFIKDSTEYMTNHVHVHLVKNVLRRDNHTRQEGSGRLEQEAVALH